MRWILHPVPTDGVCMFRSVVEAFNHPRVLGQTATLDAVEALKVGIQRHMCHDPATFKNFFAPNTGQRGHYQRMADSVSFEAYCSRSSPLFDEKFYGGNLELRAAAEVMKITIVAHNDSGGYTQTFTPTRGRPIKTIHLRYNGSNHYDWLEEQLDSPSESSSTSTVQNFVSPSVSPSVSMSRSRSPSVSMSRSVSPSVSPSVPRSQANAITGRYLTTMGLENSMLPIIREELRATPFGNNHNQFLKNHGYNNAAKDANSLVLAHMVRANHAQRAERKL